MSSYSSSHAHASDRHRVLGGDGDGDNDDDMAAVSSYLSLDGIVDDVDGEEWYRPLGEEAAAAAAEFQSVQLGQEPLLFATLQAEDGYCVSGSGGEHEHQSLPGASSVPRAAAVANDNHDRIDLTQDGGSRRLLLRSEHGKIAFKTRSDVDVLDDGYRWRKYGKKLVKNSPNPRNYYRCSSEGCRVKKRVERQRDDARFVISHHHLRRRPPPPARRAATVAGLSPRGAAARAPRLAGARKKRRRLRDRPFLGAARVQF